MANKVCAQHSASTHRRGNGESASESPLRWILGRQNVAASPAWPCLVSFVSGWAILQLMCSQARIKLQDELPQELYTLGMSY